MNAPSATSSAPRTAPAPAPATRATPRDALFPPDLPATDDAFDLPAGSSPTVKRRSLRLLSWVCQLGAATILAQTLWFKFSGAAESRWIFETLGAEPWGRLFTGVLELICVLLLLHPRLAAFGGLLAVGIMGGAVLSHMFFLGIQVQGDGGLLFGLALLVMACGCAVCALRRDDLLLWARRRLTPCAPARGP